jgi:Flagellar hook capping protein - N-terminal region/FlgD Tudor-like domain
MTQVFPISSTPAPTAPPAPAAPDNSLASEDTFLKLLVAQMKYQDPLSPTDSSQFLAQTAQFTTLETLQKMQKDQQTATMSSQTLAAASMVGRSVSYSLAAANLPATASATTTVSVRGSLPQDAAAGARATVDTSIYTNTGTKIPLTLQFTRTASGWNVQATSSGQALGGARPLTFDSTGDGSANKVTIPASDLNGIVGTEGGWPPSGVALGFGTASDLDRLHIAPGPATVLATEQNGTDGNTATGMVTGIHLTADGPQLVIGGRDIPLTSISDVHS